jgi:hypothetical protein
LDWLKLLGIVRRHPNQLKRKDTTEYLYNNEDGETVAIVVLKGDKAYFGENVSYFAGSVRIRPWNS